MSGWFARRRPLTIAAILVLVGLVVVNIMLDRQRRELSDLPAAQAAALTAAERTVPRLLSYHYASFDSYAQIAGSLVGDEFRPGFGAFLSGTLRPAALRDRTDVETTVRAASVVNASTDSAQVLLFLDQQTTSAGTPAVRVDSPSVVVRLRDVGGRWLVVGLQPV